ASAARLPMLRDLHPVLLSNADARRFSCGLVGLKGEVAARILKTLSANPDRLKDFVGNAQGSVAALGGSPDATTAPASKKVARANASVDRVIEIPPTWWDKPHRMKLRYFIPEWDDLVDPGFDFSKEAHSGGTPDWSNEVYAHQLYPEPNYDGILV